MKQITLFLLLWAATFSLQAQTLSFKGGHSHNDYYRNKPLFDALEHGMVSIEADVFFRKGELLVGHSEAELSVGKTLESLYLKPLKQWVEESGNPGSPIILMVDVKDRAEESYRALSKVLWKYRSLLSDTRDGKLTQRFATVIISGSRAIDILRNENYRLAFIDGRMNEKDIADSSELIPLISDDWNSLFSWKGDGDFPEQERQKLQQLVDECHEEGKLVRFWGIPDEQSVSMKFWEILTDAGVDLIGCDCPSCLEEFFHSKAALNK